MIDTIEFRGNQYPKFQCEGFAAKYALPFALEVCSGTGYDIGCNREEWSLPGSYLIDPSINKEWDALKLPISNVDYIFSSHCLEHIPNWVDCLNYWYNTIKKGGVLFLYLPDFSQVYWRPWNNRKHTNAFTPEIIKAYFIEKGFKKIYCSGVDLNNSFMIMGEK